MQEELTAYMHIPITFLSFACVCSFFSIRFPDLSYSKKLPLAELPLSKGKYWSIVAYNQSKLCNLLFSMELNRRLKPKGVTCNAVHPGNLIYTSLSKHSWFYWLFFLMARPFAKSSVSQTQCTICFCLLPHYEASHNKSENVEYLFCG